MKNDFNVIVNTLKLYFNEFKLKNPGKKASMTFVND